MLTAYTHNYNGVALKLPKSCYDFLFVVLGFTLEVLAKLHILYS